MWGCAMPITLAGKINIPCWRVLCAQDAAPLGQIHRACTLIFRLPQYKSMVTKKTSKPLMRRFVILILLFTAMFSSALWFRSSEPVVLFSEHPPKVIDTRMVREYQQALVLGSGGPRGFAHIGVLQVLEEAGYKPDLIVGTSMGAIIGAALSAGRSAHEMERLALSPNWFNWIRDLTWSRHGWLQGRSVENIVLSTHAARQLENLPIQVVAVATGLPLGERVEFGYGDVVSAVRASSASPGMFVPVMIEGQLLTDGDIVAPVAVATAKKLGARKILAVDVSAFADTTPSVQSMAVKWVEQDIRRRMLIDTETQAADAVIHVKMDYYAGLWHDGRVTSIAAGRKAALAALPELRRLGMIPPQP